MTNRRQGCKLWLTHTQQVTSWHGVCCNLCVTARRVMLFDRVFRCSAPSLAAMHGLDDAFCVNYRRRPAVLRVPTEAFFPLRFASPGKLLFYVHFLFCARVNACQIPNATACTRLYFRKRFCPQVYSERSQTARNFQRRLLRHRAGRGVHPGLQATPDAFLFSKHGRER